MNVEAVCSQDIRSAIDGVVIDRDQQISRSSLQLDACKCLIKEGGGIVRNQQHCNPEFGAHAKLSAVSPVVKRRPFRALEAASRSSKAS
jgi:hypothetical protein